MTRRCAIILLLLLPAALLAQNVRLTRYSAPSALYWGVDNLYNYNLYEHSRFGLGLMWVTPNETASVARRVLGQWTIGGYAAYGLGDREFKYGGSVQLRLPGRSDVKWLLRLYDDLEAAASRRMEGYRMLSTDYNSSYLLSRYERVRAAQLGLTLSPNRRWQLSATMHVSREVDRYLGGDLYYPYEWPSDVAKQVEDSLAVRFVEARLRADGSKGYSAFLALGQERFLSTDDQHYYLRALVQYSGPLGWEDLHLFAQAGYSSAQVHYSRMFDLSGTGGSAYYFRNTFLTVRPNTFMAHYFGYVSLRYMAPLPLWELSWSQPQPFLQLNAMWGRLHGQDDQGRRRWGTMTLQAPYMGLLEPATGFDGLLRWGVLDMGFATAYQICPPDAPYLDPDPTHNFAFTFVATLIFDKKQRVVNGEK